MSSFILPEDFLSGPSPKIEKRDIDFKKTDLPENEGLYATVLDNVFTASECDMLVRAAEARTGGEWEQAMINVGGGRQALDTDTRNCGRIIWDDRELVEKVWLRIAKSVPEIETHEKRLNPAVWGAVKWKGTWRVSRLNERMRFLKYGPGQYFRPHYDASFTTPDEEEISFYTLHLYLNESSPDSKTGKLEGGATTFHSDDLKRSFNVDPKVGRVLIFQHQDLLHSGAEVKEGIKLTMRTDLLHRRVD